VEISHGDIFVKISCGDIVCRYHVEISRGNITWRYHVKISCVLPRVDIP